MGLSKCTVCTLDFDEGLIVGMPIVCTSLAFNLQDAKEVCLIKDKYFRLKEDSKASTKARNSLSETLAGYSPKLLEKKFKGI